MVKLELSKVLNNFEKSTFFINQNLDTKKNDLIQNLKNFQFCHINKH